MMGTEHESNNACCTIEQLIVQQLEAASPASLPVDFITRGILCSGIQFYHNDIACALRKLCASNIIIKITEGGLTDRYKLISQTVANNHSEDK